MSGDPNVLYDRNQLDVLGRHVRDASIDLVYGVSSDPRWQEVMERSFAGSWPTTTWGCHWPIPTTVRVATAWGRRA
jgi:hypothetical protein